MRPSTTVAVLVAFAMGLVIEPVLATESVTLDGVWWNQLPVSAKVYVIEGMIGAYQQAYLDGKGAAARYVIRHPTTEPGLLPIKIDDEVPVPNFTKLFGTYLNEINDYYANNPDVVTKINAASVLSCLSDGSSGSCLDDYTSIAHGRLPSPNP